MADFYNFDVLVRERYPELVGYWEEVFADLVRQKQDFENKCVQVAELQRMNDLLLNMIKSYNLNQENFEHEKYKNRNNP